MFGCLVAIVVLIVTGPCLTVQERPRPVDPLNVQAYDDLRGTVLDRWGVLLVNADVRDRDEVPARPASTHRTGTRLPDGLIQARGLSGTRE